MSSPVIGRVQRLGLRPIDNGDMNARMYLVDGVEVTMPVNKEREKKDSSFCFDRSVPTSFPFY